MASVPEKSHITVEDLQYLDEDRWIEVVDGELVEADMSAAGFLHIIVITNLYNLIYDYVNEHKLGYVFGDGLSYMLHVDDAGKPRTRIPDVSFIRKDAIPDDIDLEKPFIGAPALAIEVTSPDQSVEQMQARVRDYLKYGSEEVWVVYSRGCEVHQYRHDDPKIVRVYRGDDVIVADKLFPGLQIPVGELFKVHED